MWFLVSSAVFTLVLFMESIHVVYANEPPSDVLLTNADHRPVSGSDEPMNFPGNSENDPEVWGDRSESPPIPSDFETQPGSEAVIILGQPKDSPYVVAIPGAEEQLLDRVQELRPQAFLTDSRRGRYVQAGAFSNRSEAEALSCQLRYRGFDARVVYFRVR